MEALLAAVPGLDALGPLTARQILALDSKDADADRLADPPRRHPGRLDEPACAGW